ncbi:MAG TPA: LysR family transcriptional regulator [Mesorhizobium sp.]|nr:LysR family transcriptional regulator [Mesorhizobium sp.]
MATPGTPPLEQLRIFLAVVDAGSFGAAARRLDRAVSVVSYGISNLEAQLGVDLFERRGTRKPRLTPAGRMVLAEARTLAQGIDGLEAEIDLAVDVMLPAQRLATVLAAFAEAFPTVSLRLHVEALGAVTALVLDRKAVIGMSGPLAAGVEGVEWTMTGSVPLVPVTAPGHPLARIDPGRRGAQPLPARAHRPLRLHRGSGFRGAEPADMAGRRPGRQAGAASRRNRLGLHAAAAHPPRPGGRLAAPARHSRHKGGTYRFRGIWRRDTPPGPAASWLLDHFAALGAGDVEEKGFSDI